MFLAYLQMKIISNLDWVKVEKQEGNFPLAILSCIFIY